jgi:hypothetical protein
MDYFVKRGERSERRPLGLADEGTETCVVSGVEVIKRIPLSNVHESESRVRRERTMKLVSKISGLATHVRVHLLPQGEKFFLTPDWDLKTVDQCYCSHQDPLLTILPRDARATASIPPCTLQHGASEHFHLALSRGRMIAKVAMAHHLAIQLYRTRERGRIIRREASIRALRGDFKTGRFVWPDLTSSVGNREA